MDAISNEDIQHSSVPTYEVKTIKLAVHNIANFTEETCRAFDDTETAI